MFYKGSRWTFQASRLKSEVLGITLMPDQLQVMNPAMVLLMIPVCPGGAWPLLPDLGPLHKMFAGGILAAMAFVCAGILQISIEVRCILILFFYFMPILRNRLSVKVIKV